MTRARDLASLGDNTSKLEQASLIQVKPSSVTVGSGSGSASASGTVTFSGCSSVSLNGVFTSTYTKYRVVVFNTGSGGSNIARLRVRNAGTDLTTGTYRYATHYGNSAADAVAILERSNTGTSVGLSYIGGRGNAIQFDIFNPQILDYTHITSTSTFADGSNIFWLISTGFVSNLLSYDSFTIFPSSDNISGEISIYGYN
jgi:hypothetical protein